MHQDILHGDRPILVERERAGVRWLTDPRAAEHGVLIAFSQRVGGASEAPYASLNLAGHVGDDPGAVDTNRSRFLDALGLGAQRERLVMAEQVHGDSVGVIAPGDAGRGAFAAAGAGASPVPETDALLTTLPDTPLMLCFADCVPVIIAARGGVAVVHSGWRGTYAGIAGRTAAMLARECGARPAELTAWIGPHIGACHYRVSDDLMSQFTNTFGTVSRAENGGLDLQAVVTASLTDAGVQSCKIACSGACTAETTDRFYSYRAEDGATGRHGALACLLSD